MCNVVVFSSERSRRRRRGPVNGTGHRAGVSGRARGPRRLGGRCLGKLSLRNARRPRPPRVAGTSSTRATRLGVGA